MTTIVSELDEYATAGPGNSKPIVPTQRGSLPTQIKALHITTRARSGAWLAEAFASDSASRVLLDEAIGVNDGLTRMRDELFDVIFINHVPGEIDALELVEGFRAGGSAEPMLVLGVPSEQEMAAMAYEAGADAYVCIGTTTTRTLLWLAARAIERHELIRENRRLHQLERQRLEHEHQEASRLLSQQRSLIRQLESIPTDGLDLQADSSVTSQTTPSLSSSQFLSLPAQLLSHYREMLRGYVIMGAGNMSEEMTALSQMLVSAGVSAQQVMLLHVQALEELVRSLGNRSARHVLSRADLLILDVIIQLSDGYRALYYERLYPKAQRLLPGF